MKMTALIIASAFTTIAGVSSASAQSVSWSGNYTVQNSLSAQVTLNANTFPGNELTAPPSIAAGSFGFPTMSKTTSGTVWSNSFGYGLTPATGCTFTTLGSFNRRTQRYSYTFSASKVPGTPTTVNCSHTLGFVNTTTGAYSANARIF